MYIVCINEDEIWEYSLVLLLFFLFWFLKGEEGLFYFFWVFVRVIGVVLSFFIFVLFLCVVDRGCFVIGI